MLNGIQYKCCWKQEETCLVSAMFSTKHYASAHWPHVTPHWPLRPHVTPHWPQRPHVTPHWPQRPHVTPHWPQRPHWLRRHEKRIDKINVAWWPTATYKKNEYYCLQARWPTSVKGCFFHGIYAISPASAPQKNCLRSGNIRTLATLSITLVHVCKVSFILQQLRTRDPATPQPAGPSVPGTSGQTPHPAPAPVPVFIKKLM